MTPSTLEAPGTLPIEQDFALREEPEESRYSDGGGLTLGQQLDSVWEGLLAAGAAGCPVQQLDRARLRGVAAQQPDLLEVREMCVHGR